MADVILTLNCGSSSIKFALFAADEQRLLSGKVENIGTAPHFLTLDARGSVVSRQALASSNYDDLIGTVLECIEGHPGGACLSAVGHRIVHGGDRFVAPCILSAAVLHELTSLEPRAPLHQAHNLAAVYAVAKKRPELVQIGCFDTAFHQTMAPVARRFGLPRALEMAGLRRYGFHGLSYEFIAGHLREVAPDIANGRILVAHLGSGASMCALRGGQSVDTSMGFSTLDGLLMSTRCGRLDPGILIYLMRQGMDAAALEKMLYFQSGLLGVSGISADMAFLLQSQEARAVDAVDLFVFQAVREAAALIATMGGLDGIVFTAGVGENAPVIRRRICDGLSWLGTALDGKANLESRQEIHAAASRIRVWVLPTNEEHIIARHAFSLAVQERRPC